MLDIPLYTMRSQSAPSTPRPCDSLEGWLRSSPQPPTTTRKRPMEGVVNDNGTIVAPYDASMGESPSRRPVGRKRAVRWVGDEGLSFQALASLVDGRGGHRPGTLDPVRSIHELEGEGVKEGERGCVEEVEKGAVREEGQGAWLPLTAGTRFVCSLCGQKADLGEAEDVLVFDGTKKSGTDLPTSRALRKVLRVLADQQRQIDELKKGLPSPKAEPVEGEYESWTQYLSRAAAEGGQNAFGKVFDQIVGQVASQDTDEGDLDSGQEAFLTALEDDSDFSDDDSDDDDEFGGDELLQLARWKFGTPFCY